MDTKYRRYPLGLLDRGMKMKKILLFILFSTITLTAQIRQDQVRNLPDSLDSHNDKINAISDSLKNIYTEAQVRSVIRDSLDSEGILSSYLSIATANDSLTAMRNRQNVIRDTTVIHNTRLLAHTDSLLSYHQRLIDIHDGLITTSINLPITFAQSDSGVIYVDNKRFIYNVKQYYDAWGQFRGDNLYIGKNAGNFNQNLGQNIGIGDSTLVNLGEYDNNRNTAVGFKSLNQLVLGEYNTGFGAYTMKDLVDGKSNVAVGESSMEMATVCSLNTSIGVNAMMYHTTGDGNVAVGLNAMYGGATNTAQYNTAIGTASMAANLSGSYNTALGASALANCLYDDYNIGIGVDALHNADSSYNIAIGRNSLFTLTTGTDNIAIGNWSMANASVSGAYNVGIGKESLYSLTSGARNISLGGFSSNSLTTGQKNINIGYYSGRFNVTGSSNIVIGDEAAKGSTGNSFNNNTIIGFNAAYPITTASNNVILGYFAGYNTTVGLRNIFIGNQAGYYETGSDKLFIDNVARSNETDARTKALIYGIFNADPASQSLTVNGQLGTSQNIGVRDSLMKRQEKSYVADDGEITLATGVAGWGEAMIGDNEEWASFRFSSDGTVTLISNTANAVNTDTDAKFCIYDAGTGIRIKNRLGSAKIVAVNINYFTP
jgi:hypothetical protein